MRLNGRIASVTGAGQGMGECTARAYAREGAKLVLSDVNGDAVSAVAESIVGQGGEAIAITADVSVAEDADGIAQTALTHFGRLDVHVNNAGVSMTKAFMHTTQADVERMVRVNLIGSFLCAQAAARVMLPQKSGRIINITSLSCQRGGVGRVAYGMSKAGLELMTKVMSVELAGNGININNIAPGAIATEMAAEQHDKATRDAYLYLIPQRRYGRPEEIADAAVFLASDDATHICGHTLNVDGGYLSAGLMFAMPGIDCPPPPQLTHEDNR